MSCLDGLDPEAAMPVYTPGFGLKVGMLPLVSYSRPGSVELAETTARALMSRNSVLLQNHGLITLGVHIKDAFILAEEIEENAMIHFLIAERGHGLNPEQIKDLINYTSGIKNT